MQAAKDPQHHCSLNDRSGFTLVELVITVLIIGILAAVAAPRYAASLDHFRVEAAAKRIVADLSLARREAKMTDTNQSVNFTLSTNSYDLPGVSDINHSSQTYVVNLSDTGYPATLVSVSFDGNTIVTFDQYGVPHTGSPLSRLVNGTIIVASGGEQRTIIVNATTGKASVP